MGYSLAAVIAPATPLSEAVRNLAPAHVVSLAQGMALVPVTDELHDLTLGPHRLEEFVLLAGWLQESLEQWSARAPFAYVEADFSGGVGEQRAAVWEQGRLALGPLLTGIGAPVTEGGSAISRALRRLGVRADAHHDEFATAGLMRHRHTQEWAG